MIKHVCCCTIQNLDNSTLGHRNFSRYHSPFSFIPILQVFIVFSSFKLLNDELYNNLPFGFIFRVVPVVTEHKESCMI